jgi:hypothetical protein
LAPRASGDDVERDLLAFAQAAHAGRFNSGGVHEHVLAAAFRRDEAKAFGGVEELDGSDSHKTFSCIDFHPGGMPGRTGLYGVAGKEVQPSSRRAL